MKHIYINYYNCSQWWTISRNGEIPQIDRAHNEPKICSHTVLLSHALFLLYGPLWHHSDRSVHLAEHFRKKKYMFMWDKNTTWLTGRNGNKKIRTKIDVLGILSQCYINISNHNKKTLFKQALIIDYTLLDILF